MDILAILVVPHFFRLILSFEVYRPRVPVVFLPRNIAAPFQEQDPLAGGREFMSQGAPAGAGADDDDIKVVLGGHLELLSGSGSWFASLVQRPVRVSCFTDHPFAAWLVISFEPSDAAPKLTPKRAHQMLTDLCLFRSASAGTS